jgi:hypothetical protein
MSENPLRRLQRSHFFHMAGSEEMSSWQPTSADAPSSQKAIADIMQVRAELNEVPHSEQGMNISRMADFLDQRGIAMKPLNGVDLTAQRSVNGIIGYEPGEVETLSSHIQLVDYTYVRRDGVYERIFGTAALEAFGIHEAAHDDELPHDILTRDQPGGRISYKSIRCGLADYRPIEAGDYLAEAAAEYASHEYVTKELGNSNGFSKSTDPILISVDEPGHPDVNYLLPASYTYQNPQTGTRTWPTSAHAAFGLQLLIAWDPSITPALWATRTDPTAVQDFAHRIDALDDGLYDKLRKPQYEWRKFARATGLIIDRLYGGDVQIAAQVATDIDYGSQTLAA